MRALPKPLISCFSITQTLGWAAMTVCIAAMCNGGKSLVVCADRMFTNPALSVEFETSERKIEEIGKTCVAMAAGNSVNATAVIEGVKRRLGGNPIPHVADVAAIVKEEYVAVRNAMALQNVIMPMLGADFARFRDQGMPLPTYLEKQPPAFQSFAAMCSQQNLGTDILIAGTDASGAHVFHVSNPGSCWQLDKLGYAAIGSGGIHATIRLSLGGQTRSRELVETLAEVYNAKRAAEVAPGVGGATDIAVIDLANTKFCATTVMDELKNVHDAMSIQPTLKLGDLRKKYDEDNAAN
jgi:hypothetical protein